MRHFLSLAHSNHPFSIPQPRLHILAGNRGMLDPYGSYYLCIHCRWVHIQFVARDRELIHRPGGKFAEKHVPLSLRRMLLAESAANDGLAYPFLTVSLYLALESSKRVAIQKWFLIGCLCMSIPSPLHLDHRRTDMTFLDQVILGTILGAVLGCLGVSTSPDCC
jgi:hypothetical protein